MSRSRFGALLLGAALVACREAPPAGAPGEVRAADPSAPTRFTEEANARFARELALDDPRDFEDARRGLLASDPEAVAAAADGTPVWDTRAYAFVTGGAPSSVN